MATNPYGPSACSEKRKILFQESSIDALSGLVGLNRVAVAHQTNENDQEGNHVDSVRLAHKLLPRAGVLLASPWCRGAAGERTKNQEWQLREGESGAAWLSYGHCNQGDFSKGISANRKRYTTKMQTGELSHMEAEGDRRPEVVLEQF